MKIRQPLASCVILIQASLVLLFVSSGCNGSIAAISAAIGSGGSSGGGGNSQAVLSITAIEARTSPAKITFTITDAESDVVDVELFYVDPNTGEDVPMLFVGAEAGLAGLGSLPEGMEHTRCWDFADASQLGTTGLTRDVAVEVVGREADRDLVTVRLGSIEVGNDPPVVTDIVPSDPEGSGNVLVKFTVSDSSSDLVSVRVEYDVVDDDPDFGFQLARPSGESTTPEFAFVGQRALETGTALRFFWDTDFDLAALERDVLIRFTPMDEVDEGPNGDSDVFRVDNNREPRVTLDARLLLDPDVRRGIPIPFTVFDDEADDVQLVFQWRRASQPDFKVLPEGLDLDQFRARLEDPTFREENQICTEIPLAFGGRVVPVDATRVRLPELASSASSLVELDPETFEPRVRGELEILRNSGVPTPVAATWSSDPVLREPVAALPIADGLKALVLERLGMQWRLREVELATGGNVIVVASGSGMPSTMTYESTETSVLIALVIDETGTWQVRRVDLDKPGAGNVGAELVQADGSTEFGTIRGVACLGRDASLITVRSSLIRLYYPEGQPARAAPLFGPPPLAPLQAPWGIAIDPLNTNRIYLAERASNRVLAINLDTLARQPVVEDPAQGVVFPVLAVELDMLSRPPRVFGPTRGVVFPRPEGLALERSGTRLLVVTDSDPEDGTRELTAVQLGGSPDLNGDGFGDRRHFEIQCGFPGKVGSVATGPDDLRLVALPDAGDLAVGGGVFQKRTIVEESGDYRPKRQLVSVETPFDPQLATLQPWRVRVSTTEVSAKRTGTSKSFVWDSEEVHRADFIFVRAIPFDNDRGGEDRVGPKRVRSALDVDPLTLGDSSPTDGPFSVTAADLDGDGDLDLVSANFVGDNLTVFFQESAGVFDPVPIVLGNSNTTNGPRSVAAADLDGDGDLDLVSANFVSDNLTVFFQESAGVFDPVPIVLGNSNTTDGPRSVVAADLDGDGDLDLVSANFGSSNLTVFFQETAEDFRPNPLVLTTEFPFSVAAADLDGDGDLDLVSANGGSSNLTVFFQERAGIFGQTTPLTLGDSSITNSPRSVAVADFDGDGNLDLVSANFGSSNLTVFFQETAGYFNPIPLVLGNSRISNSPVSVAVGDFDGDGDLDLVSANFLSDNLTVFFQESDSQGSDIVFGLKPLTLGNTSTTDSPNSVAAADLDGDGDLDLVSANRGSNLTVFFQESAGVMDPLPLTLRDSSNIDSPISVAVGDFDGDGDLDLVSANFLSNNLAVFFQESAGLFDPIPLTLGNTSTTDSPVSVAAADLDGDGDLDIVSANAGSNNLTVFFQIRPGVFDTTPLTLGNSSTTNFPASVAVGDFDGDGDLDLVSANGGSNNLTVFFKENDARVFDPTPLELAIPGGPLGSNPVSVAAGDFDGDGNLDLVSANLSGNLTVFFQKRAGVFDTTPHTLGNSSTTNFPVSVVAADLDGDGDLDIVSANQGSSNLTVFFQERAGIFDPIPLTLGNSRTTIDPVSVAVADLDGDGDLDLVSANLGGDNLTVFFQERAGIFNPIPFTLGNSTTTDGPGSVVVADLDGDGDLEIVSANSNGDDLTLFFGGSDRQ